MATVAPRPQVTGVQYGQLDWFPHTQLWQVPLPEGDRGIRVTVAFMNMAAAWGEKDPQIRQLALQSVSGVANNDTAGEIAAIFQWVMAHIAFRGELDETIQSPEVTLNYGAGDCDDFSILLAALLGSIGYQWEFRTVARGTADFKHVYLRVLDHGSGQWTALDATVSGSYPGWEPPALTRTADWGSGLGMAPKYGYLVGRYGMGDASQDAVSILQAATPLVIGETQAVEGAPVQGSYGYSYQTPGIYAGNPYVQPSIPLTQRAWFWPGVILIGGFALYRMGQGGRR